METRQLTLADSCCLPVEHYSFKTTGIMEIIGKTIYILHDV